jgi:hypothetical protein
VHGCISTGAASGQKRRSQGIARRARACPHGNSSLVNGIRLFLSLYFPESSGRRTEAGAGALARWCGTQPGAVVERCSTSREEAASCAVLCAQTSRVKSGKRGNGINKARACPHGKHVVSSTKRSDLPIINFFLNHRAGASAGAGGLALVWDPTWLSSSRRKQPLTPPHAAPRGLSQLRSPSVCRHADSASDVVPVGARSWGRSSTDRTSLAGRGAFSLNFHWDDSTRVACLRRGCCKTISHSDTAAKLENLRHRDQIVTLY